MRFQDPRFSALRMVILGGVPSLRGTTCSPNPNVMLLGVEEANE